MQIQTQIIAIDVYSVTESVRSVSTSSARCVRRHPVMTDRQVSQPRLPRVELDAFDLALIDEVMRDGRATYEALARAIGLSRPATRARMRRLLESNVLQVVGVVHPSVFGLRAYAHLAVTVEGE